MKKPPYKNGCVTRTRDPHLHKRNGVFYYRRRVPQALHQAVGRQIVQFSLNTSDRREAVRLKAIHDVQWDAQFRALGVRTSEHSRTQGGGLSSGEVIRIVRDYVREADGKRAQAFLADPPHSEAERAEMQADADIELAILANRDDPRSHEYVYATTQGLFGSPEGLNNAVGELVRQALLEIAQRRLARASGDESRTHFGKIFDPNAFQEVQLEDAAKQYLDWTTTEANANGVNRKWLDKQAANVATLVELVGKNTPVRTINFDSCQDVRKGLASIPAHRNKLFPGIPLLEAVQRAQSGDYALLSPTTQQQYLDTFRGILGLAVKKGIIATNPADGIEPLKRDVMPAHQKRRPLRLDQLQAIFGGQYYTKCSKLSRPYEADKTGWRFWLPLLCLFLGLRPNEACQMNAADVKVTKAGTLFLDIVETNDEDEAEKKSLKTLYSRRKIPVHPELIRMGFAEYAKQRQEQGASAMLFHGLKADSYGSYSKYPLRRFRETFFPQEVKLEKRQSFYSFRHNFRDACRDAKLGSEALQALGAWSQGHKTSDDYGDASNPDFWADDVAKIAFKGLDLSHLYSEDVCT